MINKSKVLIVATSRKTRGGITAVIKAYEQSEIWENFNCYWVQTHCDKSTLHKIVYFILGLINFILRLPFYDIVHIHTSNHNTERRKRIFAFLTKLFNKKLIVHVHSPNPEDSILKNYKKLYQYSFSNADKIIILSNTWKNKAIETFKLPEGKIEVLYNPCPIVIPSKITERENYILFSGTIIKRKGYDILIKAFAKIANKFPTWHLKFAGNGEIEEGLKLAQDLNIKDRVEFLGWVNGEEKDKTFRHASIYCLPSFLEGFPMGVLDAWAYYLPVITTPIGGLYDITNDEENCIIFTPGNIECLSQKIEKLISNKELYEKVTIASANFAEETFNIQTITKQLENIYNSLSK